MKLLINKADDISYTTALECVKICMKKYTDVEKIGGKLLIFNENTSNKRIIVYAKKNKQSISFVIYYEVERG